MDGKRQAVCLPVLILRACWAGGDFTVRASEGRMGLGWCRQGGSSQSCRQNPGHLDLSVPKWGGVHPESPALSLRLRQRLPSVSRGPGAEAGCSRTHRDPLTCLCKKSAWKRGTRGSFSPCTIRVGHWTRGSRSRQMLPARHETALLRPSWGRGVGPTPASVWPGSDGLSASSSASLQVSCSLSLLAFFL